jgi:hypothetical protein
MRRFVLAALIHAKGNFAPDTVTVGMSVMFPLALFWTLTTNFCFAPLSPQDVRAISRKGVGVSSILMTKVDPYFSTAALTAKIYSHAFSSCSSSLRDLMASLRYVAFVENP